MWRRTHYRSRGGHEEQTAQIGGTLVTQGAGGVDEGADAVSLQGRADEGGAPRDSSRRCLLGANELLLGVGFLGALIRLAKKRGEDWERT